MPSPHHRVGLVADDPIREALETVRKANEASWPEARTAREAVFDGAFFEALRSAVIAGEPGAVQAAEAIEAMRELLPSLELSAEIKTAVAERIDETMEQVEGEERRRRQLELLATPDPHGETVLALAEEFDQLDRFPG